MTNTMPSTISSTINSILNFSYRTSDLYGSCIVKDLSISSLEIYKEELHVEQDVLLGRKRPVGFKNNKVKIILTWKSSYGKFNDNLCMIIDDNTYSMSYYPIW